jgi:hypothetical protein
MDQVGKKRNADSAALLTTGGTKKSGLRNVVIIFSPFVPFAHHEGDNKMMFAPQILQRCE